MSNMANDSSFDDIEEEVSSWGFSMSVSDYERSLIEDPTKSANSSFPRGLGIADSNYISNVKLASELNGLIEKAAPMGHLPTTKEVLNDKVANEITPLLRQLGISGHDGPISSKNTRTVAVSGNDIRIEGNLPIILNGDLFAMIKDEKNVSHGEEDEPYDPRKPLHEQFSTIKEFAEQKSTKQSTSPLSLSISSEQSSSASDQTSSCTTSSSSSSITNFSVSEQDSEDELCQPLLHINKQKLYTPRQLYDLKRKECLPKGKHCRVRWVLFCSSHRQVVGRSGLLRLSSYHQNPFTILENKMT